MATSSFAALQKEAFVGRAPFCPECDSLLTLPSMNPIECDKCSYKCTFEGNQLHVTRQLPITLQCYVPRQI